MAGPNYGRVDSDCTYTIPELCGTLKISQATCTRMLEKLELAPLFANTKYSLISGRVFNQAVEAHQQQLLAEFREDDDG